MAKPGNKTFYKDGRRYGNDPEISNLDAIPFLFLHDNTEHNDSQSHRIADRNHSNGKL